MNERPEMSHGTGMGMGMGMSSRMWHWACCILPVVTLLMWLAGIVFLVFSWVSLFAQTPNVLWGIGPEWWIWNAVIFGILASYGRGKSIGKHDGSTCC